MAALSMWEYWRDKHGYNVALYENYPDLISSDPVIKHALTTIITMQCAIDARMSALQNQEEDE
jgi:hypothetical protein